MFQLYFKSIRWFFSRGIVLSFIAMLLLPLYGWLSPWPAASEALKKEGLSGLPLMIGVGGSNSLFGDEWKEERQRSFIVIPESLRRMEIITYREIRSSEIEGVKKEIMRNRALVALLVLWLLAGIFSTRIVLRALRRPKMC